MADRESTVLVMVIILGLGVGLCRAYKSHRERPWLLTLLPVAIGLLALLSFAGLDGIAFVLAGHVVAWSRVVAEKAVPFLLPLLLLVVLWRAGRRWSRSYRALSPLGRGRVLLLSVCLGLAISALLRVTPVLPDAAGIAGEGARAGLEAGVRTSLDEAAERLSRNGGEAP